MTGYIIEVDLGPLAVCVAIILVMMGSLVWSAIAAKRADAARRAAKQAANHAESAETNSPVDHPEVQP